MNLEKLVSRQVELLDLKHRLEQEGQRHAPVWIHGSPYGPCLLISREHGSGARAIAECIGRQLGWQVFDREIVEQIAQRAQARQQLIEGVDERVRSKWETFWHASKAQRVDPGTYLYCLRQVLLALGHQGDVIILGRGAQYLLPPACALRVRLIAPLEARAERIAERTGHAFAEARLEVQQTDNQRARFIRATFGHESSHPANYDLVLNTGEMSQTAAAEIMMHGLAAKLAVPLS
jgi:cytidylate kinase